MPPFNSPALAADCVIFQGKGVLLIKRGNEPFKGHYALPGGGVEIGETVEQACIREMQEETGLEISRLRLIGVYSRPDRDPRGHVVSIAFLAEADLSEMKAGSDAAEVELVENWRQCNLAFDHREIIEAARKLTAFND
jgi:8-oxo-dGTP diphosphatase